MSDIDICLAEEREAMTTELSNKSIEELHILFAATSHDLNSSLLYEELARRLEEAQQRISDLEKSHELVATAFENRIGKHLATAKELEEAQQCNAAHDARVAAEAKAEALEEIPAMVRDFCADQGWDEGYLHNLETLIRDKAAEYRAKAAEAGRKE